MTSFGWKRRATVLHASRAAGVLNESDDEDPYEEDWNCLAKKSKIFQLEDPVGKSQRLVLEGEALAEEERYWEAIRRWNEALELTPDAEKIHEMKAQALLELGEVFESILAAEKAVKINPCWPYSYQTLGRAQMNYGEVELAIKNFSRAIHIDPTIEEVWQTDLSWALRVKAEEILRTAKQRREKEGN